MNFIFWIAIIYILFTLPFVFTILLLYLLKLVVNVSFKIRGPYKITNFNLSYKNEDISFQISIDLIKLSLSYPRLHLVFSGIKSTILIIKSEFKERNHQNLGKSHSSDISFIKEKFSEILREKLWINNKSGNKILSTDEITNIDDVVKKQKISYLNKIFLFFSKLFDFNLEHIKLNLKSFSQSTYYSLLIKRIILGAVKSTTKKSEIDIIAGIYDLNIIEYRTISGVNLERKASADLLGNLMDNFAENTRFKKCHLIRLNALALQIAFLDGFFPAEKKLSFSNRICILIEGRDLNIKLSNHSVNNIISLIISIIIVATSDDNSVNNNNDKKRNSSYNTISSDSKKISCIEQLLLKKLDSQLNKIEVKIEKVKIDLFSDNYQYKFMTVISNTIKIDRNTILYGGGGNINVDLHLGKNEMEIHFMEVKIYQIKNRNLYPVTEVPLFSISVRDNIIYHVKTQKAEIYSSITGRLSDINVSLTTNNLSKIIELVNIVIDAIDLIEYVIKHGEGSFNIIEQSLLDTTKISIEFSNMNAFLYNDYCYTNLEKINFKINMENIKGISKQINLNFDLINFSFGTKLEDASFNGINTSHIIIDGFRIHIDDNKQEKKLKYFNFYFADTLIISSDRQLLPIIKFTSEIIAFILKEKIEKKYNKILHNGISIKKRKTAIKLIWNKIEIITILHELDMLHWFVEDFTLTVDEEITIPKITFYHSTLLQKNNLFHKFADIIGFSMKFRDDYDQIQLDCDELRINYYEANVARPLAHLVLYSIFFPKWLEYYFTYQFLIDKETQLEKYKTKHNESTWKNIRINLIQFDINDNPVTAASIFQADKSTLLSKYNEASSQAFIYLKNIKNNLLTLKLKEFNLEITSSLNVTENNDSDRSCGNYYDKLNAKTKVRLDIEETKVNLAGEKDHIFLINNFIYEYQSIDLLSNFNPKKILTKLILYDRHTILMKKIDSDYNLQSKSILFLDNRVVNNINNSSIEFIFQDVKVFDKTLTFIIKAINAISNIPIKECQTNSLMDKTINYSYSKFHVRLKNLSGHISSVDPKSNEIYNTLDLLIDEFDYLSVLEKNYNLIKTDEFELTLFYLIFGFAPSQKSGFPLLILPLCEINGSSKELEFLINIPTDIYQRPKYINSGKTFNEIYKEELNQLVLGTKSLTIFLNYKYLSTCHKIFMIFLERTKMLRNPKKNEKFNDINNDNNTSINSSNRFDFKMFKKNTSTGNEFLTVIKSSPISLTKIRTINSRAHTYEPFKQDMSFNNGSHKNKFFRLILFDLKIIYLMEYKEEYEDIFSFHKYVKEHGYFGYIIRVYSFVFFFNELKTKSNLDSTFNFLTMSFLNQENLNDDDFFVRDSELKTTDFINYKDIREFNDFFFLDDKNEHKVINKYSKKLLNLSNMIKLKKLETNNLLMIENMDDSEDLRLDYKNSFIKFSKIEFSRNNEISYEHQKFKLVATDGKVSWNKFNKDVLFIIIFKDLFLILDKMVLSKKKDKKTNNDSELSRSKSLTKKDTNRNLIEEENILDKSPIRTKHISLSCSNESDSQDENIFEQEETQNANPEMTFDFTLVNLQFVVQNEIKCSALLLICKEPIKITLINKCFVKEMKDIDLKICCKQFRICSPKIHREKSNIIYWMDIDNTKNNIYYLVEDEFFTLIESPQIVFKVGQKIEKNEKLESKKSNDYKISTKTEIKIDKIKGNFDSIYFNAFLDGANVLLFDRGFSFSQSKKSDSTKKEDMKKYKKSELEEKIKNLLQNITINNKTTAEVIFKLEEVSFDLGKNNEKFLQFIMKTFEGNHQIHEDKSSQTQVIISKLLVNNIENDIEIPVFISLVDKNPKGFEDKINMITLIKNDRYVSLESKSLWYVIEYVEFTLRPVMININKKQIMFILDFFFANNETEGWIKNTNEKDKIKKEEKEKEKNTKEELDDKSANNKKEENNDIEEKTENDATNVKSKSETEDKKTEKNSEEDKKINKKKKKKKEEKKGEKEEEEEEESYPMYFKQFKVNEILCILKFEYAEAHPFNIPRTKLKFQSFEKHEKFYTLRSMIDRCVGHLKKELIKNLGNIISGLFGGNDDDFFREDKEQDKVDKKEAIKRRLLLGDK